MEIYFIVLEREKIFSKFLRKFYGTKKMYIHKKCLVKAFTFKNKGTKKFLLFDLVQHQEDDLRPVFVFR